MNRMKKIYLAIPYGHNPDLSFLNANKVSAEIMKNGNYIVFSPISHSHPIARQEGLPHDWDFWKKLDESFIEWADEIWVVYCDPDLVEKSKGVQAEIAIAETKGKPIRYITPTLYPNDGDLFECKYCGERTFRKISEEGLPACCGYLMSLVKIK